MELGLILLGEGFFLHVYRDDKSMRFWVHSPQPLVNERGYDGAGFEFAGIVVPIPPKHIPADFALNTKLEPSIHLDLSTKWIKGPYADAVVPPFVARTLASFLGMLSDCDESVLVHWFSWLECNHPLWRKEMGSYYLELMAKVPSVYRSFGDVKLDIDLSVFFTSGEAIGPWSSRAGVVNMIAARLGLPFLLEKHKGSYVDVIDSGKISVG